MRGAMIKTFGEPTEVLELVDVREPMRPAAGEVLVGVDVIQGAFPVRPSLPSFVGNEGAGRILAVGSGVEAQHTQRRGRNFPAGCRLPKVFEFLCKESTNAGQLCEDIRRLYARVSRRG